MASSAPPPSVPPATAPLPNGPAPDVLETPDASRQNEDMLRSIAAPKPANSNSESVFANRAVAPSPTASASPSPSSNETQAPSTPPVATSSMGNEVIIVISVSLVVFAALAVSMLVYMRRQRNLRTLYRQSAVTPPQRVSSLVRNQSSPESHMYPEVSEIGVPRNAGDARSTNAEAWGVPQRVPAAWPAHLPRPAYAKATVDQSNTAASTPVDGVMQMPSEQEIAAAVAAANTVAAHGGHMHINLVNVNPHAQPNNGNATEIQPDLARGEVLWDVTSHMSDHQLGDTLPVPADSLNAFHAGVQPPLGSPNMLHVQAMAQYNAGQNGDNMHPFVSRMGYYDKEDLAVEEDDTPLSDELDRLMTITKQAREKPVENKDTAHLSVITFATADSEYDGAEASPDSQNSIVPGNVPLSPVLELSDLVGILSVSADTMRAQTAPVAVNDCIQMTSPSVTPTPAAKNVITASTSLKHPRPVSVMGDNLARNLLDGQSPKETETRLDMPMPAEDDTESVLPSERDTTCTMSTVTLDMATVTRVSVSPANVSVVNTSVSQSMPSPPTPLESAKSIPLPSSRNSPESGPQ
ncbi:hypothetical protein THASP1DRAFT_28645 [Thamnocephalis sphaerospora]|uniref:Uncharacterized protein n=1 Tax=Thamnocephalis sphaerospora TaxID=78915 RepID=A0A4P9XVY2_9FUNG|nr:hypothetical protein THASP1DRAFT_28645 [Thamnocephalis sphaerospora]|eukprot:RKP09570.1 hypothetical protein THASP1DRAFT_28645 [Thamnocephalis sphaerospora]